MHQPGPEYNEEGYYSDGNVWVTSRRLIYGDIYQVLSDIRSARVRVLRQGTPILPGFLTLVLAVLMAFNLPSSSIDGFSIDIVYVVIYILLACMVISAVGRLIVPLFMKTRLSYDPVYAVSIKFKFLSTIVTASTDRAYIERIVEIIQYALARQDGEASAVEAPRFIGQQFEVPKPVIRDHTLYAGQTEYDLREVRSSRRTWITAQPWLPSIIISALLVQQLFTYANKYFESMRSWTILGEALIVIPVMLIFLAPVSGASGVYTVQLTTTKGAASTIYATIYKADADQVRQSLQQAIKGAWRSGTPEEART
jgi:hypothetical protein